MNCIWMSFPTQMDKFWDTAQSSLIGGDIWAALRQSAHGPRQGRLPPVGFIPLRSAWERESGRAGEASLIDGVGVCAYGRHDSSPRCIEDGAGPMGQRLAAQLVQWPHGRDTAWSGHAAGPCDGDGCAPAENRALVGLCTIHHRISLNPARDCL